MEYKLNHRHFSIIYVFYFSFPIALNQDENYPQIMIIDAHAHIFSTLSGFGADGELKPLSNGKAIWSTGEVIQLLPEEYEKTEFSISSLLSLMDKNNIDKAVLLQGGFLGFDNHGVWEGVEKHRDRIRGAFTVDPFCRNVDKILGNLLSKDIDTFKFEVSTGCGLMGIHHSFPLDGDMMYSIYKRLYTKVKTLAFDLGSPGDDSHQVDAIRRIAEDFPSFNIVVCHLSSPRRNQDYNLKRELDTLSLSNIYFDTAALWWKTRPEEYPFGIARRYLEYARNIVGAEHLMWGSDVPSTLVRVPLSKQLDYSDGIFSERESEWYYYKTAEKVYF